MLRNGFEIIETSACVDAQNYDQKLGEEICMKKIKDNRKCSGTALWSRKNRGA